MKKIVFMTMIMQQLKPAYMLSERSRSNYKGQICFPITVKLAEKLEKNDEVKFCIIKIKGECSPEKVKIGEENLDILKNEMEKVNEGIGAKITYSTIESDFTESKDVFKKRFMEMFSQLEENCEIYADITFGTKPTTLLFMNILQFAENFYDADIEAIVYGKTEFDKNHNPVPELSKVCDVTVLYLLNNLMNSMNVNNAEEAKKSFEIFFGL